ncbi:CPBP family intramembrane glutamic endopeptidase [Paucisalibacillus globulus]|uniref:CPBP family intramembrane glutamic endopeptidase n=1 Tax=Paucisalibacillus globulus TaxID=351095 RepID=UPI0015964FBC|nr:CPBP family intramembrane glutamic endopeptidase [Paucisalibacillus globulus]
MTIFIANLIIFNRTLTSMFDFWTREYSYSYTSLLDNIELFQFLIYTVIIAPIMEEVLFRIPISIWMNRLTYFILALLISSILFGFIHPEYPLFGFVLGVSFGFTYKLSRSIVPAILIHVIWNIFSLFYFNYI